MGSFHSIYGVASVPLRYPWLRPPPTTSFQMSVTHSCLPLDYKSYPTMSELISAEHAELSVFLSQAKKATLECLLHETFSQLSQFLKQNNTLLGNITENNNTLQSFTQSILSLRKPVSSHSHPGRIWSVEFDWCCNYVSRTESYYDNAAEETKVFYNVPKVKSTATTTNLDQVLSILKVPRNTIRLNKRLGPDTLDNNVTPRPLELVVPSNFG